MKIIKSLGARSQKFCSMARILDTGNSVTELPCQSQNKECDPKNVKPFEEIPHTSMVPFFGAYFQYKFGKYKSDMYHISLIEKYHKYGGVFKETMNGDTNLHVFEPDDIREIFRYDGQKPLIAPLMEPAKIYRKLRNQSPGLGNTNGEEWHRLRSSVSQSMLKPLKVASYLPEVNEVTDDFVKHLGEVRCEQTGEVKDYANEVSKFILESGVNITIWKRLGTFEAERNSLQQGFIDAGMRMLSYSTKLRFGIPWYKLSQRMSINWNGFLDALDYISGNGQDLIDECVSRLTELTNEQITEEQHLPLICHFLKTDLEYHHLSRLLISLFEDGLIATGPSLTGQLFCLANNPDKQEKLYQEIQSLTKDNPGQITLDILNKSHYLKACIKEGFRFYPLTPEVMRITQKEMNMGGYRIPEGTVVKVNNYLTLQMEKYFQNADSYIPERWLRDSNREDIHPFVSLPFSFGARACIGKRFAEQDMQMVIIKLLQKYKLKWPYEEPMRCVHKVLFVPDKVYNLRLIPRN